MSKRVSKTDSVRRLKKLWDSYYAKEKYLKCVSILGAKDIRGITDSSLNLIFPVSVLCGANGAGKTTFLALSTLGFHANKSPLVPLKNIEYFDFNYFFKTGSKEKHKKGINVKWTYTDNTQESITKGEQRWMRYIKNNSEPRRPRRGTEFVGISRITPAFEKKNYSSYFSKTGKFKEKSQNEELKQNLSKIMGKQYKAISELSHLNSIGSHTVNNYNNTHTSFNAGAGEECLTHIISTLLNSSIGSFIAIEEIEIGLHPSTLKKLIDVILEIAEKRKLQILITSHSTEFLRNFPTEGLILAERNGNHVEFINKPNVEYAISRIGGDHKPACGIICEDAIAGKLISSSISAKYRKICPIIAFGGKDQLLDKAKIFKKIHPSIPTLIIWDGEASKEYIKKAQENGIEGICLPGNTEPENYLISKISTQEGINFLNDTYDLTTYESKTLIDEIKALTDPHDIFFIICEAVGMQDCEDSIQDHLIGFVAKTYKSEFDQISEKISSLIKSG